MSKSDKDFRVIENRLVNKLNSFSEINKSEYHKNIYDLILECAFSKFLD